MSFAKITIVGNLGQDPETRYLQNGTLVINFSIAAQGRRRGGNDPETTWFRVSAFGEQAERIATMVERGHIKKGRLLYVEGQFEVREYTANDGAIRTSNDVNLSDWQFLGSGNQQGDQSNQSNQSNQYGHHAPYGGSNYGDHDPSMDEVPF